jgi:PPOX class probable FMN-dependent enzyme
VGEPVPTARLKIHRQLCTQAMHFIEMSPLMFISTADAHGCTTVSPRGGAPGFVRVKDSATLLIPERRGNRLLISLGNVLENDKIGLLFLVPGCIETLRVHGSGSLIVDEALCSEMASRGTAALLVIQVDVTESFFHCGKAFVARGTLGSRVGVASPHRVFRGRDRENVAP